MGDGEGMNNNLHLGDFTSNASTGATVPNYYGDALIELAASRPDIVALNGDLAPATECAKFKEIYPDRFFSPGIAEANMVGMAAGMARNGDVPFVHTFSVFISRRAFDQVAMQVAYPKLNVKLSGFLPGLTTLLGVSHQAIEDMALMRSLPNMTLIEPCCASQIPAAVRAAAEHQGPVYLRMHRPARPMADNEPLLPLHIGKAQMMKEGSDAIILASGHMVAEALSAANTLDEQGAKVSVANIHSLKPLDVDFVIEHARRTGAVVTAENHSIIGGLGSAVAETLLEAGVHAKFKRVGIQDTFAEGGSTDYLFDKYGLSAKHIVAAVQQLLS
ncbi:MAG: transketolase C-terminal domain-containing protein [Stappiaceae bacterium]